MASGSPRKAAGPVTDSTEPTLIGSALAVIYGNYYARLLFIEIAKQEKLRLDFEIQFRKGRMSRMRYASE